VSVIAHISGGTVLKTKRGLAAVAASLMAPLVATTLVVPPAGAAGPYDDRTVISEGHLDLLYPTMEGSDLVVKVHDEATADPGVLRDPSEVLLQVRPSVDGRTANDFIAQIPGFTSVGGTVYVLPNTNISGRIFAGFGHGLPAGSSVNYAIAGFEGPGNFAAWLPGDDGPDVKLNSTVSGSSFSSAADHEHMSWGFSAEGEYELDLLVSATLPDSSVLTASPVTYTFFVGEELPGEPGPTPGVVELSISGLAGHYHAGGIATLTATQTPQTDEDHYHWFTRAPGETEYAVVPDAFGATYGFIVQGADNGTEVIARLYDHDHALLAESAPATIVVDDHGNPPYEGPTLTTTLAEEQGILAISVDEGARDVTLTDLELNSSADRYVATGAVGAIRVTDTRSEDLGWTASGRVRAFTSVDGDTIPGANLGWTPKVVSSAPGQTVVAGDAVSGSLSGGEGVAAWRTLGQAGPGGGRGSAELGADLVLEAPTTLPAGTYQGLMLLTVI
jgi:surface-anchored protein